MNSIEQIEEKLIQVEQTPIPVTNLFAKGIYWREVDIPAGTLCIGHEHKTEHLNVLLSGRVRVLVDGRIEELVAPMVFASPPRVRKMVYAVEPTRWANVHANPTDETDMAKLEIINIKKSETFLIHQATIRFLKGET